MFNRLTFSVTFPSTGQTISDDLELDEGLTAITGPNWSGKSLRLEMLSYALWGTSALRGTAEDYEDLRVLLRFTVGGVTYQVCRSKVVEISNVETGRLATGHRAVNAKVREILGFGKNVFDTAVYVPQGQVEALGAMEPAERKRMVDSTIGLDALDEIARMCADEASGLRKRAEGIREGASRPEEPVPPDEYGPSDKLEPIVRALREDARRLDEAEAFLKVPVKEPVRPERPHPDSIDELEDYQHERRKLEHLLVSSRGRLSAMPALSEGDPEPDEVEAGISLREAADARERLRTRLASLRSVGVNRCPSCRHEWPLEAEAISRVEQELEAYADVPEDVPEPSLTRKDVDRLRRAREVAGERSHLEVEIAATLVPPDRSKDLQAMLAYEQNLERYDRDLTACQAWKAKAREAQVTLINLGFVRRHLPMGERQLREALIYEKLLESYQAGLQRYEQAVRQADELDSEAADWAKARVLLGEVRRRVKQHLCPLLSLAASLMVRRMSGGQLTSVVVTDDFEITVDGRKLCLLSGAGKAIANLAVRLGLGQVLTQGVLPVLLLDEPDAAMDADNAEATAEFVKGLKGSGIRQVLLVTHKRPEGADRYVEL